MYGGTIREDPEYPGILSIPDTTMYGGTNREDPEYPGILKCSGHCLFRTLSVRWYVWGDNSGGSPVSRDT